MTLFRIYLVVILCLFIPFSMASGDLALSFIPAVQAGNPPLAGTMSITYWSDKQRKIQQYNIDHLRCYIQHGRIITVEVEHSLSELNLKLTENDDVLLSLGRKPPMTGDTFLNNAGRTQFVENGIEIGEVQVLDSKLKQKLTISGFLNCTEKFKLAN